MELRRVVPGNFTVVPLESLQYVSARVEQDVAATAVLSSISSSTTVPPHPGAETQVSACVFPRLGA